MNVGQPEPGVSLNNNMSESLSGSLSKLEFKYFDIQLFHAIAIVLLIPKMNGW